MTNELGRELTTDEHIAVATGKMTIMDIVHGVALEMDAQRDAEIEVVMPSGIALTRGEIWREMHRPQPTSFSTIRGYFPRSVTEVI